MYIIVVVYKPVDWAAGTINFKEIGTAEPLVGAKPFAKVPVLTVWAEPAPAIFVQEI